MKLYLFMNLRSWFKVWLDCFCWKRCCRGASLCSGNLHPDAVLCQEQSLKADKKKYYSKLQDYHNEYGRLLCYVMLLNKVWFMCHMLSLTMFAKFLVFSGYGSMITYLQELKDTWESSKDPEKEVLQNTWRFVPASCCTLGVNFMYNVQAKQTLYLPSHLPQMFFCLYHA